MWCSMPLRGGRLWGSSLGNKSSKSFKRQSNEEETTSCEVDKHKS